MKSASKVRWGRFRKWRCRPKGGLAGIALAVDGVIGEQLTRFGERLNWN